MRHKLTLVNETHYSTRDLRRFFITGLNALTHGEWKSKHITVVYARHWKHGVWGCAYLGSWRPAVGMRFAVPKDPGAWTIRDLALTLRHEHAHNLGIQHGEMDSDLRDCSGPTPEWAQGLTISVKVPKAKPKVDVREKRHAAVLARIAKWERMLKTAERRLKKLRRQDAYYRKAMAARPPAAAKDPGGSGRDPEPSA